MGFPASLVEGKTWTTSPNPQSLNPVSSHMIPIKPLSRGTPSMYAEKNALAAEFPAKNRLTLLLVGIQGIYRKPIRVYGG